MDPTILSRRRFVAALIALSGSAAVVQPRLFSLARAWADSPGRVDEAVRVAMVRMARLLYPHDALPDTVYADVLDQALSATATGAAFAQQLDQASAALNQHSSGDWSDLDAGAQVEAMRELETEPYFVVIQNEVRNGIYYGSAFWALVGYPGPSKDFGGYLHRGAGDIDWLPGDP